MAEATQGTGRLFIKKQSSSGASLNFLNQVTAAGGVYASGTKVFYNTRQGTIDNLSSYSDNVFFTTGAGGLTAAFRVEGGMQTKVLALKGEDGRAYTFRGIQKDNSEVLEEELRGPRGDLLGRKPRPQACEVTLVDEGKRRLTGTVVEAGGRDDRAPTSIVGTDEGGEGARSERPAVVAKAAQRLADLARGDDQPHADHQHDRAEHEAEYAHQPHAEHHHHHLDFCSSACFHPKRKRRSSKKSTAQSASSPVE